MNGLKQNLKQQKSVILDRWLDAILKTYPADAAKFMRLQRDQFRNPVGHTFSSALEILFDELVGEMNEKKICSAVDNIVRIRAVQDFSPSESVSFMFQLKSIIFDENSDVWADASSRADYLKILARIDKLILITFDIYSKCRENIFDIRLKEIKKWSTGIFEKRETEGSV